MRAFASDLDRTLIYSKRMIDEYGMNEEFELIETLEGREISYVSLKTKAALKQLSKEMRFIPVTTRTVEQYKRISLFQSDIQPEYAITTNGGAILKSGVVLKEWSDFIKEQLSFCMPINEMIKAIKNLPNTNWIEQIRQADDMFIYLIVDRSQIGLDQKTSLEEWAKSLNWQMSLQGRKLYFIPNPIDKWKAVEFLCNELNIKEIYGAGDSLLDYSLIKNSAYGIAPSHGEVLTYFPNVNKTESFGMKASDDILEAVQSRALLKS